MARADDGTKSRNVRGPSVIALLFGFWALVAPLGFSGWMLNADGDLPRHLVLGQHILTHGVEFPDIWSHTKPGEIFTAYEWLSEVIFAGIHSVGGLAGVAIFSGLLVASSVAVVAVFLRGKLETGWILVVCTVAVILTFPHWIARPHLFSFLCVASLLLLVRLPPSWRRTTGLFFLFAAWANCHPGFLYGLVVYSAFLVGGLLDQYSRELLRANVVSILAAIAGTFMTPVGWHLHLSVLEHLRDSRAFELIEEFQPVAWTEPYGLFFFSILAFLIWVMSVRKESLPFSLLLPFFASLFGALVTVRNVPLFALFGLPILMYGLASTIHAWHWKPLERPRRLMEEDDRRSVTLPYVGTVLLILGLLVASSGKIGPLQIVTNSFSREKFPVEAVRRAREAGLDDHTLLNQYRWGGYLLYAWPEQLIFIDGMANFFGSELMEEYYSIWLTQEGWQEKLRDRGVDLLLLPPDVPLAREARKLEGWTVWYEDPTATVLLFQEGPTGRSFEDPDW